MTTPASQKNYSPVHANFAVTPPVDAPRLRGQNRRLAPEAVDALLADESIDFVPSDAAANGSENRNDNGSDRSDDSRKASADLLLDQLSAQLRQLQSQQRQIGLLLQQSQQQRRPN